MTDDRGQRTDASPPLWNDRRSHLCVLCGFAREQSPSRNDRRSPIISSLRLLPFASLASYAVQIPIFRLSQHASKLASTKRLVPGETAKQLYREIVDQLRLKPVAFYIVYFLIISFGHNLILD